MGQSYLTMALHGAGCVHASTASVHRERVSPVGVRNLAQDWRREALALGWCRTSDRRTVQGPVNSCYIWVKSVCPGVFPLPLRDGHSLVSRQARGANSPRAAWGASTSVGPSSHGLRLHCLQQHPHGAPFNSNKFQCR